MNQKTFEIVTTLIGLILSAITALPVITRTSSKEKNELSKSVKNEENLSDNYIRLSGFKIHRVEFAQLILGITAFIILYPILRGLLIGSTEFDIFGQGNIDNLLIGGFLIFIIFKIGGYKA